MLNHVLLHQTVIGQEALKQMEMAGETRTSSSAAPAAARTTPGSRSPSCASGCGGIAKTRFLAVEPASCPSLTKGEYRYDFGDTAGMTPLVKMHTLGNDFVPAGIHAGGLRYHGMAPDLPPVRAGLHRGARLPPERVLRCGDAVRPQRGHHPGAGERRTPSGPRSTRRVGARRAGEERVIVFNLSGHGYFDMTAYDQYLAGELTDVEFEPQREAVAV